MKFIHSAVSVIAILSALSSVQAGVAAKGLLSAQIESFDSHFVILRDKAGARAKVRRLSLPKDLDLRPGGDILVRINRSEVMSLPRARAIR